MVIEDSGETHQAHLPEADAEATAATNKLAEPRAAGLGLLSATVCTVGVPRVGTEPVLAEVHYYLQIILTITHLINNLQY